MNNTYWVWEHEEVKSQSLLLKDQQDCRKLARQEADQVNYFFRYTDFPFYWPYYDRQSFHRPYWGWNNHYRFLRWQDDYDRFFHLCMRAKGWRLSKKVIEAGKESESTHISE
ncbi:MAG: hypothetical protein OQK50_00625 [Deltaproteobacteria bacterium]|nr:hypothetical protein [Deltaproteobacteria bacterium]MCW9048815.1 hypothetical protein [Deltaproteobacteria bacterium]